MLYGAERVDAALRRNRGAGAQALVEALRADALAFAESDKPTDDLSLLVVRYRGRRPAARPGTRGRGKAPRKRRAG
jgi:serine phosphatase RsbU (regulator of sigma subunit)